MSQGQARKKVIRLGHVSVDDIRFIVLREDYKCFYTKVGLTPRLASLDHMVAVSDGGSHSVENLCVAHTLVNRAKGTMTASQFIHMCHLVAASHEDTGDDSWVPMRPAG
jgi:hypothetical protein